jgi:deoxyribose-phosphate aldolase
MHDAEIAVLIDHTNLRPDAGEHDIRRLAAEAVEHGFRTVCTDSRHIPFLVELLEGSGVPVCSVAGFPLGTAHASVKALEAERAVALGAGEVDMVLSVADVIAGEHRRVEDEIRLVREAIPGAKLKVIIECGLLTDDQKRTAAKLVVAGGADFVKTSTGFGHGGATLEDVRLLRETVGAACGVKASGGIRTREQAEALVEAGANRLGTSAGVAILNP